MNNIEKGLSEVRKAYRLVFDFQSKVLGIIDFIGNSYGRNYAGGYPKFCRVSPGIGKGKLDLWGWDWLNMYFYEFHFGKETVDNQDLFFSVFLVADTGYYEALKKDATITKIDSYSFKESEESQTKLIFVVGQNKWQSEGVFDDNWNNLQFILQPEGVEGDEERKMIFKSYNLSQFSEQEKAIQVLKNFEDFCLKNRINFKYKEREIS